MHKLTIDGVSSDYFGLYLKTETYPTLAANSDRIYQVMGSDKSLIFKGEYLPKELPLILYYNSCENFEIRRKNARQISKWLTGKALTLSYTPDVMHEIINTSQVDSIISHPTLDEHPVTFTLQPIYYSRFKNGEMVINDVDIPINLVDIPINQIKNEFKATNNTLKITNYGTYKSKPIIVLSGASSTVTLSTGGKSLTYTGLNGTVYIDCAEQIVHDGTSNKRSSMGGDYLELMPGDNQIVVNSKSEITIYFDFKNAYL